MAVRPTVAKEVAAAARNPAYTPPGFNPRQPGYPAEAESDRVRLACAGFPRAYLLGYGRVRAGGGAPFVFLETPANFANLLITQDAHSNDLATAMTEALRDANGLAAANIPNDVEAAV